MSLHETATDDLLQRAGCGEGSAVGQLLQRHRRRLKRLVAARLDRRLAPRVDPSDIVQESLADAGLRLPQYLRERPVPYYRWLKCLALHRLNWWRRFHLEARKRSVTRDRNAGLLASDASAAPFVERLAESGTSPSGQVIRDEERQRALAALGDLAGADRKVLELRYLDGLSFPEIAAALEIGLSAVKMRHLRALERFRGVLVVRGGELE